MAPTQVFQMGPDTFPVPFAMHRENRDRLVARFRAKASMTGAHGIAVFQGGEQKTRYSSDTDVVFRQESYFQFLFGVREADCFGALDLRDGTSFLFIPRLPEVYAVWMGRIQPPEHYRDVYGVDRVHYTDEIATILAGEAPDVLYLLKGVNSDSGIEHAPAQFAGIERFSKIDVDSLHPEINECRVIKTAAELDLLRYVNKVSSRAHVQVMRQARVGMNEYDLEAIFLYEMYRHGGCRHASYTCICGAGEHGAVLHYGHGGAPNDGRLRDGDMCLMDMGAEYHCYASDITCSFPANGRFTEQQRLIYNVVLASQRAVFQAMRPGVAWADMHRLAERVILEGLTKGGLLVGDIEEMRAAYVASVFMPHGLGHLMGLDVHDVGGYPPGTQRIDEPGIRKLRTTRTLQAGMVLTVEPGIYFIDALLDPALADPARAKFFNAARIAEFRNFGGVRLEDDVIVTETGIENMTNTPREIDDVEAVMAGKKDWPIPGLPF